MRPTLSIFNFSVQNQANDTLDINIDGSIVDASTQEIMKAYWGDETSVSFKSFRNEITKASPKTVNVYVNSGGGHVGDAMAIHDFLVELQSKGTTVNTSGRGIVASAATYIVMAGKANSSMSANSWFMIHNVSGGIWGDVNEIENYARTLRKFNNTIRDYYATETGLPPETISALMNKETWLTANETKDKGFVKNITGETNFKNEIKPEHWQFSNTAVLNAYNSFTHTNNSTMDTKKITDAISNGFTAMLEKLGIANKAEDANVIAARTEFTTVIENALKGIAAPDEASIKTTVDNAIAEALKTVPENFTKAISDATSNLVTKDDIKNNLNKADLTNELTAFNKTMTESIVALIGNKSTGEDAPKDKKKVIKNRYSDAHLGD
jgi:ATP-dependent Clp endopeptidase proteolytic subunit ClpP